MGKQPPPSVWLLLPPPLQQLCVSTAVADLPVPDYPLGEDGEDDDYRAGALSSLSIYAFDLVQG